MDAIQAIRIGIECGEQVCMAYLNDLTDAEMMKRPCAGCNHINWQVGHLIASEHSMIETVAPGSMPALPAGFAEQYSKDAAGIDDPKSFRTKSELMETYKTQRAATLAALAKVKPEDLSRETGVNYAPNVASMYSLQGSHWLMHAGQWAVVRRELGRAPVM